MYSMSKTHASCWKIIYKNDARYSANEMKIKWTFIWKKENWKRLVPLTI